MVANIPYQDADTLIIGEREEGVRALEELLRTDGYRNVKIATGHDKAAAALDGVYPDLVVLDLGTAEGRDLAVLDGLRAAIGDPYAAVMVLSGEADQATRLRLFKAGAKDFATKPFNRAEVLNRIRNLVETRLVYKRLLGDKALLEQELRQRTARHRRALTAVKAAEARLSRSLAESEAESRAKSDFVANYSHELRTPLNAILGFSEMLANETFGPHSCPKYKEYAKDIHESGAYLLGLINDILDYSKAAAGKLELDIEDVDVADSIDATVRMFAEQTKAEGIRMKVDIAPDFPIVRTDERRLRQVLNNLVSNAVKFTPRGGLITIRADVDPGDNAYIMVISDNGIGIEPDDIPRIMEPYGQVREAQGDKYKGTGLGLPLTRRIVEGLGGTIEIHSKKGVGTAVTLRFPPEMAKSREAA